MLRSCEGSLLSRYDPRAIRVDYVARHVINANSNIPDLSRMRWKIHVVDNMDLANAIVLPVRNYL